jgi:predicted dehydrogenase
VEFESGCVANFTASRVSTERVRKLRFFQPHQYLSLDYTRQDVVAFTIDEMPSVLASTADPSGMGMLAQMMGDEIGAHPSSDAIKITKPTIVKEEPLMTELRAFIQAVRERSCPVVSLEDGRRALALALEINQQIEQHFTRLSQSR